jgi:hypothetical protein
LHGEIPKSGYLIFFHPSFSLSWVLKILAGHYSVPFPVSCH